MRKATNKKERAKRDSLILRDRIGFEEASYGVIGKRYKISIARARQIVLKNLGFSLKIPLKDR